MAERKVSSKYPLVAKKINESLGLSIKEGSFSSAASGFGSSYFSPFALAMNATSSQIGILNAFISFFQSLVQLSGPKIIGKFSRKKIVIFMGILEVLLFIPIILCGLLFYNGYPYSIWIFILLVGIFYGIQAVIFPAWFSWIGSLVADNNRGEYFSKRNRRSGFFGILALIFGALILDFAKKVGLSSGKTIEFTLYGFGIIFCLSVILRIISLYMTSKHYEPKLIVKKKDYFSFWEFLKRSPTNPFGRFVIFIGFFSIAVGVATPFFTVYMIRDLGFSYFWFMAVTASSVLFQLSFLPFWGKISDKFGNIELIKISVWATFLVPLAWASTYFIKDPLIIKIWLIFVPSFLSGISWAGFNLATNNYVYDSVKIEKREEGVSYMNLIIGVAGFIGAVIGSIIVSFDIQFINSLIFIFIISGFLRLITIYFGVSYLKEVRHVKKFSSNFIVKELSPMKGILREVHNLESFAHRVEHHI